MWWLILLLLLILLNNRHIDSYQNYLEIPIYDCDRDYNSELKKLNNFKRTLQPFGYTKSEYLDKTRFIFTKEPLPTDPDFFMY